MTEEVGNNADVVQRFAPHPGWTSGLRELEGWGSQNFGATDSFRIHRARALNANEVQMSMKSLLSRDGQRGRQGKTGSYRTGGTDVGGFCRRWGRHGNWGGKKA